LWSLNSRFIDCFMNQLDVSKRSIGITFPTAETAQVLVWAPKAEKAAVVLEDQKTTLPLEKDKLGYWKTTTNQIRPGDLYRFVLNGETVWADPVSLCQPQGVHGPSQAVDERDFNWTDGDWQNRPLDDYLIYELHTGTFTPEGTFAGIEEKLDYLKELGVTAIEIMPIAQFPGPRNWGYDGVFPYAVQDSYGGIQGLQHLVNVCHQKGIAVVLDVVYNHLGPEGAVLGEYGPYYTSKYCTPWGDALNFDDSWCDGVRQYFIENALMWLRDFHIDALRMDAVHAIKDGSPNHILREIKQHVDLLTAQTGRTYYLIAECDLNDPRYINPISEAGYGLDAQWIDEFHHSLRVAVGGERSGYYGDFNGVGDLAKSYRDAYVYDGQFSEHRNRFFGVKAETNPGRQFVVFSQNHDQIGNRMLGERSSQLFGFEMQKLMAGAVLVSPFLPMLFMGEEWSEPHPFFYFVSHTDPVLAEAVRKGRKAEFAAFHLEGEAPDPMSEETFQESKLQWELLKQEPHRTMFRYYQTLIALRKSQPALHHLDRQHVDVRVDEERKTLLLHRWYGEQQVWCLMNFSENPQAVSFSTGDRRWHKLLDSADTQWQGPGAGPEFVDLGESITLQPQSLIIYANTHV